MSLIPATILTGFLGSGKTTLVERVIGVLSARGLVVSLVKHAHHSFDIDHAGKDSWRHRQAGCSEGLVAVCSLTNSTGVPRGAISANRFSASRPCTPSSFSRTSSKAESRPPLSARATRWPLASTRWMASRSRACRSPG